MKTLKEVWNALMSGKTIQHIHEKNLVKFDGEKLKVDFNNGRGWYDCSYCFSTPSEWEIYNTPEIYEFECVWKSTDPGPVFPDFHGPLPRNFYWHILTGKKTKIRLEVLP